MVQSEHLSSSTSQTKQRIVHISVRVCFVHLHAYLLRTCICVYDYVYVKLHALYFVGPLSTLNSQGITRTISGRHEF